MKNNYGLTNTELLIMELFWSENRPMTFREIMEIARRDWKKEWKVQTLNTFLNGLQKMGMIQAERSVVNPYNEYHALCTRDGHIHRWTKQLVEVCYNNSFKALIAAYIGEGELTEQEKEEVRKVLETVK